MNQSVLKLITCYTLLTIRSIFLANILDAFGIASQTKK